MFSTNRPANNTQEISLKKFHRAIRDKNVDLVISILMHIDQIISGEEKLLSELQSTIRENESKLKLLKEWLVSNILDNPLARSAVWLSSTNKLQGNLLMQMKKN